MSFTTPVRSSCILALLLSAAAWAQTPDLRGIWLAQGTAFQDIEKAGVIVDPPSGKIPYLPAAVARRDANLKDRAKLDPETKCFQAGLPRATYLGTPFQIFQNASGVHFVYQDVHAFRVAHLDRSKHNDGLPFAMGDSRATWDGQTLVIDVASFSGDTWLDRAGNYHSDALHLVERYTRVDPSTLRYEARIEDPKVYSRPWTIRLDLKAQKGELAADDCEESPAGGFRHAPSK